MKLTAVDVAGSIDGSDDGSADGFSEGADVVGDSDGNDDGSSVIVQDQLSGSPGNGSTPHPLVAHEADAYS